jgi:hypothetical protein
MRANAIAQDFPNRLALLVIMLPNDATTVPQKKLFIKQMNRLGALFFPTIKRTQGARCKNANPPDGSGQAQHRCVRH